ncbi:MAG TPA: archaellum operon transcriptional activator EarA family protein [Candidatus Thermoplasmatota archaeon]|nr:archaellum operon transcriptional activator EarA family protein [Candidatus Thermoplasmatota archaeon]
MPSGPRDLDRSRRRARLRDRVLVVLARKRTASLGELSKATGIRPSRVLGILEGDEREYAPDLSLTRQGAAVLVQDSPARFYAITPSGSSEAERSVRGV